MPTTTLHMRIEEDELERFRTLCQEKYHRKANAVLREMISAFNDGRIAIIPDQGQVNLFTEVYVKGEPKK